MGEKQDLKVSEARILVYLAVVDTPLKTILKLSSKLDMDYSYCCKVIKMMIEKKWITIKEGNLRSYYFTTMQAPLELAKQRALE